MEILGFTGTRQGMTRQQKVVVTTFLSRERFQIMLNGACEGADRDAYHLAMAFTNMRFEFLPGDPQQYAWAQGVAVDHRVNSVRRPEPYLERNREIVRGCSHLLAIPAGDREVARSGTWATIRAARRLGKPVTIVYPDGTLCT